MEKRNKLAVAEAPALISAGNKIQLEVLAASRKALAIWSSSRLLRALVGAVAVLVVLGLALHQRSVAYSGDDIRYFSARAQDLLAGRDPYAASVALLKAHPANATIDIYLYDPFLYLVLSPLTALPFSTAWTIWATLNGIFLLVGSVCFVKAVVPRASAAFGLVAAAAIALTGMGRYELFFGNVDMLFLCLLAATFLAARRDKPILAGVLLGLCATVYLQSLPFALFYFWKREDRIVRTAVVTFVLTVGGAFLYAAPSTFGNFLLMGRYFVGNWAAIFINQSIYGVAVRLFEPTPYSSAPLVNLRWLPPLLWVLLTAVVLVLAARTIRRTPLAGDDGRRAGLEFALALAALLLIFPMLESNTLVVLGLLVLVVAIVVASNPRIRAMRYLGAGIAVLYLALDLPLTSVSATRLGMRHGLHGTGLILATFTSVPYLYLTIAAAVCVLLALKYSDQAGA